MENEVIIFDHADLRQRLVGQVIRPEYDDPHLPQLGLRVGAEQRIHPGWFPILVRQTVVRKELNKFGFIEIDFENMQFDASGEEVDCPLYSLDPDYTHGGLFGGGVHGWEGLRIGESYDPTVLIPHSDANHIALVPNKGRLRKSDTGVIGRKAGIGATIAAIEEFVDEDSWHQPFKDVAAKHLPALREMAENDEKRAPYSGNQPFGIYSEPLTKTYSDWLYDQISPEVGVRQKPEANICYARLNELVMKYAGDAVQRVKWHPNKLLLLGHAGLHFRILNHRGELTEPNGLARKNHLADITF